MLHTHDIARTQRAGQAMIESLLVMIVACLLFFALFQYAELFTAKLMLSHAAARAARARAVGFNRWMVDKSARVAMIPASGRRVVPPRQGLPNILAPGSHSRPGAMWQASLRSAAHSPGSMVEVARVPEYMESVNSPTAGHILDYELWGALDVEIGEALSIRGDAPGLLRVGVRQRHPLLYSLGALYEGELRRSEGEYADLYSTFEIENHYPLYMEDMHW